MKTITKNIAYVGVLMLLAMGAFVLSGRSAEASPNMSGSGLYPTVVISNYTECQGYGCWNDSDGSTREQAVGGDIISVGVYYKNTGTSMATGVRLKLSPQTTGNGTTHSFSGQVTSSNGGSKSGSARVDISGGAQRLSYDSGRGMELEVYPSNSTPYIQGSASDLFGSNGLLIGSVPPGHDGMLTVHYDVSNNTVVPVNRKPEIHTTNADLVTNDSARLHGDVNANGTSTNTWFEYDTDLNDLQNRGGQSTARVNRGNSTSFIAISSPVSGLQSGTVYYFMACAENSFGEVCDPFDQFRTSGTPTPVGQLDIETLSASNIDRDSAELRGDVNDEGAGSITRWFEYDTNRSDVENDNGTTLSVSGTQNGTGMFGRTLTGLQENETYYYRACGRDISGDESCGSVEEFTTDDDNNDPSGDDEPDVETHSAGDVDEDSAELRGEFDMNDADNGTSFFAWSDNRGDVEDVEDENEINDISNDVEIEIINSNLDAGDRDTSVEERITGLREDETYYYAFCIEYDDEDNDQHIKCGSVRSFTTDDNGNNDHDRDERPEVSTNPAINVGTTYATLSGFYDTNDEDAKTFFEYGSNSNLNNRTSPISRNEGRSGLMTNTLSNLVPGQTYYFRACIDGDQSSIRCGAILSFTTVRNIVVPPEPPRPPVVVVSGGASAYVELDIDDGIETTQRRLVSTYEITWKNISKSRLEKVDLQVVLPKALKFLAASKGQYSRADHKIIVNLDRLDPGEEGQMTVTVSARVGSQGDVIVTQAVLAFETPSHAQETAIEFDANTFAGAFGFGFMPNTLVGWLLLILVILIIIILAQYFYERSREYGHGHDNHGGHGGHGGGMIGHDGNGHGGSH